jgi:hypothetical protein
VKRITLILATVATMAVMILAAAAPALADHGYEWTDWWQWRDTNWWCSTLWAHDDDDGWDQEYMFCYNVETGNSWTWP